MADEPSQVFIGALVNEQFGLQSASGATISESSSRAALFFSSLSSGLVAVGFASSSPTALTVLVFTVLPTVFLLGCFTVVRLVDTSIQNIVALQRIEAIREYWSTLDASGRSFFPPDAAGSSSRGVRYGALTSLFTTATMVAVVDSVLAGSVFALALSLGAHAQLVWTVIAGALGGAIVLLLLLTYQHRRLARARDSTAFVGPLES